MNHFEVAKEEMGIYGPEETSLQNILAILIGPKAEASVTGELASKGINQLSEMSIDDLKSFKGIGLVAARRIASAFGLANYINKYKKESMYVVRSPDDAAKYVKDMKFLSQEHFEVVFLNTKNEVIGRKNIFKGSLNASIVHPREVYREALRKCAASIICAHNHPSGQPSPSKEDIEVTKRLAETGKIVGIELLDHIVIGHEGHVSLKEKGYI